MERRRSRAPAFLAGIPLLMSLLLPLPAQTAAGERRPDAIEIKFAQGLSVRVREGRLTAPEGASLAPVEAVLLEHPVQTIERLFSQPEAEIVREREALAAQAGAELPDLNLWYRLTAAPGTDVGSLCDALNALPEVQTAYPAPLPAPPPGAAFAAAAGTPSQLQPEPPTPSYAALQRYERAAPAGIDAGFAWALEGGSGRRVTIVDVEYSFNPGHEDLPSIPVIGGAMYHRFGDDHGTAVLGELAGVNNGYGVLGIAHGARIRFSSPCANSGCSPYAPADAVNTARLATVPGDVILIEQQTTVCNAGYGPLEWIGSVFDAVRLATAARRTVVAAAGNGGVNLDQAGCSGAFDRAAHDSGAIIVGAGAPPGYSQADRSRLSYSSHGSRVDLQGWGAYVVTAGYGNLHAGTGANQWYTDSFSGTSSASPIVAGAAALLSSISRQRGAVQSPGRIRSLLASTGTPQQNAPGYPVSQRIGPRPNLRKAIIEFERPRLLAPVGAIAGDTPTYRWTKVPGATRYHLAVHQGATRVISVVVPAAVCAAGACVATPATALSPGVYTWRARAYLDAWKAWGAARRFTLAP